MKNIKDVISKYNIDESNIIEYGKYMAKVDIEKNIKENSNLILVTAITPTKHGEGKTTVSIGLNDSLNYIGKNSILCLREPSLGPVFGMKGGACGGGKAIILPDDKINLHFTGDFHAITSANNLLVSAIYNHIYQGNLLDINKNKILFKRCLDINDRELRSDFNITAASEIMAIFCLAKDKEDLRERLKNILVAYTNSGKAIYAKDLKVDGAMFKLLSDAFIPNVVQTLYNNPAIVHGGPFANIAQGTSSVNSLNLGLTLADYVVTEAGFASDLGFEKFMNIIARENNIIPSFVVLVTTIRALKENGYANLDAHIDNIKQYNVPFCVALNQFDEDNEKDIAYLANYCKELGTVMIKTNAYINGELGSIDLANYIVNNVKKIIPNYLYNDNNTTKEKIENIIFKTYHANNINYSDIALKALDEITKLNVNYSICVAKTQYSISDNKDIKGYPKDYTVNIRDIKVETGARLIIVYLNKIITMPGLPKDPNYILFQ